MVENLTNSDIPLAYWVGYNEVILVSANQLSEWSVDVSNSEEHCVRVFPRRWIDIAGRRIDEVWEAARRALIGVVLQHPGVTQVKDLIYKLNLNTNRLFHIRRSYDGTSNTYLTDKSYTICFSNFY